MASGADQEDLERKFRDYMQSFAENGHLTCPVCGELAWEYDSSSLATANRKVSKRTSSRPGLSHASTKYVPSLFLDTSG